MRILLISLRWVAVAAVVWFVAFASPARAELSQQDLADVARVEEYLNGFTTAKARFVQIGPRGEIAEGNFYLSRPNRLRFEYDPPLPILIVGDGLRLIYYDKELDHENAWPIGATPLAPLLGRTVTLGKLVRAVERDRGVLRVTLVDPDRADEGSLTLVFTDGPLELRQWTVVDAQMLSTVIALSNLTPNPPQLDPDLFFLPERPERR